MPLSTRDPAAMTLSAGVRLGPYEIAAPLGAGGMGEVYRGTDTRLGRTVAIKILPDKVASDPVRRARFEREARAVSSLNHPHICALYDIGRATPSPQPSPLRGEGARSAGEGEIDFLVMEYCEGDTLADRLAKRPMRLEQALQIAIEIADALDKVHGLGLAHRDLKPSNVMLTASGVKLLDFGVAKWRAPESSTDPRLSTLSEAGDGLTAEGTIIGTLHYMAPEQLEGKEADARADMFAFGAVLYEVLTGRQAFEGKSRASVIAAVLSRDPAPLRTVQPLTPPALERVVQRCLAKDLEQRWQSARDLGSELRWIAQERLREPTRPEARRTRRERLIWIAASLALLVMSVTTLTLAIAYARRAPGAAGAIQFDVLPPNGALLSPSASLLAVAPDGRHVAFLASSAGGSTRLWIRSLDSAVARELPGTDEAFGPFWSPDSRYLAFFADGRLKKLDISGGPPAILANVEGTSPGGAPGGSWNREGIILFGARDRLYKVSEDGGAAMPVTSLDESQGEIAHVLPHFLPNGRHFTYVVQTGGGQTETYLASLDSGNRSRLFSGGSQAVYAPPGFLLFVRDAVLFAQRFDTSSLQLTGEPRRLAEEVGYNPANQRAMFSVSQTGVLAYRAAPDTDLVWLDRSGRQTGSLRIPDRVWNPALSPDGRRVAIDRLDPGTGIKNIWIIEPTRSTLSRLSFGVWDHCSVWSPDGSRMLFGARREGIGTLIEKASSGAGEEKALLESPEALGACPNDWSRDGRFIVYDMYDQEGNLWLLPAFGDRKPALLWKSPFRKRHPQLSPDGRWLAYSSDESGRYEVYVQSLPGGDDKWPISSAGGIEPRWRADGKELFYIAADRNLMAVPVKADGTFQVGTPTVLFATRADGSGRFGILGRNQYDVTGDGERFLINQPRLDAPPPPITVVIYWSSLLH